MTLTSDLINELSKKLEKRIDGQFTICLDACGARRLQSKKLISIYNRVRVFTPDLNQLEDAPLFESWADKDINEVIQLLIDELK